jgi:hypothetical protein
MGIHGRAFAFAFAFAIHETREPIFWMRELPPRPLIHRMGEPISWMSELPLVRARRFDL